MMIFNFKNYENYMARNNTEKTAQKDKFEKNTVTYVSHDDIVPSSDII